MGETGDAVGAGGPRLAVLFFVAGALATALLLSTSVPLDSLATPTRLSLAEMAAGAGTFLGLVVVMEPLRETLGRSRSRLCAAMRWRLDLGAPAKVAAAILAGAGTFAFGFWALADVLGGYQGYNYAFARYPLLARVYDGTVGLVPYVGSLDKGTQASLFLALAGAGVVALRLRAGLGAALKDAATLFVAPLLVVFELGLWYQAPEDMTWHVTDFLSIGGLADGGYRSRDFIRVPFVNYPPVAGGHFVGSYVGGAYIFSNWIVLFVCVLLVASRLPGLSLFSARLWEGRPRVRGDPHPPDPTAAQGRRARRSAVRQDGDASQRGRPWQARPPSVDADRRFAGRRAGRAAACERRAPILNRKSTLRRA